MRKSEDGIAIVVALMAILLLSALSTALILTTSSEMMIAGNFRNAQEALYAADAALERAMDDLATVPDWNPILNGSTQSTFIDGRPNGVRVLSDNSSLDLGDASNMVNCQKVTVCSASDLIANTLQRPWGTNNPVWQLYAYGALANLLPIGIINSPYYVIVFVADDPSENDNDPLQDGSGFTNPGTGVLALRGEAFGPRGAHKIIEVTVARAVGRPGMRVLSWREIR